MDNIYDISEYTNYDNIKNPFNFRSWWNTLISASDAPYQIRVKIYENALRYLPGSYKLWYNYLKEAREYIKQYSVDDRRYEVINDLHERALIFMNKMPRIWINYCQFLIDQRLITKTRHSFDKALMSIPVTQHERIWEEYIKWIEDIPSTLTTIAVYKRYLRFNPDGREGFVLYLVSQKLYENAVTAIVDLLNDDLFYSKRGKSKFDYWLILCEIISKHSDEVKNIDCEGIIRYGLTKYTDEVGRLWVSLSNYYIRQGLFEKARDIFEEGLSKVSTVRDFSLVFNSYLKFEEEMVNNLIEEDYNIEDDNELDNLLNDSFKKLGIIIGEDNLNVREAEINLKLFRISNLIERRPFLLSDALLRQNPNNVKEWLKRIKLCKDDKELLIANYERAINTLEPIKAIGRPELLWINYAKYYESIDDIKNANLVFYKGINTIFKSIDQISNVWCEWAEMHLRIRNYYDALEIVKRGCTSKTKKGPAVNISLKLWSFYVDLEERLGSLDQVRAIYQRIIELKIANTQTILNFCDFLEKNHYYEETFRVFEQAINYFTWPHAYDIWIMYLSKFVDRYQGEKIERARDLFEQVIASAPKDKVKIFYYMYSDLEEEYGLLNNSIRVLDSACNNVTKDDKPEVFSVLISKTASFFGITKTRNIFSRALEVLEADQILDIGLKFAAIERKLGEIDRSRSILIHLSQFCDPSKQENIDIFWNVWEEFEKYHGNEDTYREMHRIKRSVAARYSLNAPLFIAENKIPI